MLGNVFAQLKTLDIQEGVSEGFGRERVCLKFLTDNLKARGVPIVKGILFYGRTGLGWDGKGGRDLGYLNLDSWKEWFIFFDFLVMRFPG